MVDGVPEVIFKRYYGEEGWKSALDTSSVQLDEFYPRVTRLMPDAEKFLNAVSILEREQLADFVIVSFMGMTVYLGIWNYTRAVEGAIDDRSDNKTTPEMFTRRVYPRVYGAEKVTPGCVIHIGDSRTSDRLTAESVPDKKWHYVASGKGKCGTLAETM